MVVLIRLEELKHLTSSVVGVAHWGLVPLALYLSALRMMLNRAKIFSSHKSRLSFKL